MPLNRLRYQNREVLATVMGRADEVIRIANRPVGVALARPNATPPLTNRPCSPENVRVRSEKTRSAVATVTVSPGLRS